MLANSRRVILARYSRLKFGMTVIPFVLMVLYAIYIAALHFSGSREIEFLAGSKGYLLTAILIAGSIYLFTGLIPILIQTYLPGGAAIYLKNGILHFIWSRPRAIAANSITDVTVEVSGSGFLKYTDIVMKTDAGVNYRVRADLLQERPGLVLSEIKSHLGLL